jgi:hypothetical protein
MCLFVLGFCVWCVIVLGVRNNARWYERVKW